MSTQARIPYTYIIYLWLTNSRLSLQVLRNFSLTHEGNIFLFCLLYLGVLFHANLMESLVHVLSTNWQLSVSMRSRKPYYMVCIKCCIRPSWL